MKVQADYHAQYVTRLTEEIAKLDKKVTDAAGNDREDYIKAESEGIKAFYNSNLTEQKDAADFYKAQYDEIKRVNDLQNERDKE